MRWNKVATAAITAVLMGCLCAQAGAAELSVTNRLQDRREVASGQRSYAEGFEDGYFYANGWHTTGEMGGVWAPPMKLLDGVWFGVNGSWIGQATRFTSGWGYTRYDLPDTADSQLQRTDFAPDAYRAVLFGLKLTDPGPARTVTVNVDAHSRLHGHLPWQTSAPPNESTNVPDHGAYQDGSLVFTDDGTVGGGVPVHHYAALVASPRRPSSGTAAATGGNFRGPQRRDGVRRHRRHLRARAPATTVPSARAPAASWTTPSRSRPTAPRLCGSPRPDRTRGCRTPG